MGMIEYSENGQYVDEEGTPVSDMGQQYWEKLDYVSKEIDEFFNPNFPVSPRKCGYVLFVFNYEDDSGHVGFITNRNRDLPQLLRSMADRLEELTKREEEPKA